MDEELRTYLDGINVGMGGIRADMAEMKSEISGMKSGMTEIRSDMAKMEIELKAHTETVESRLLKEFWKWARTSEIRSRQQGANLNAQSANALALDERLATIEDRVSDLERRQ